MGPTVALSSQAFEVTRLQFNRRPLLQEVDRHQEAAFAAPFDDDADPVRKDA